MLLLIGLRGSAWAGVDSDVRSQVAGGHIGTVRALAASINRGAVNDFSLQWLRLPEQKISASISGASAGVRSTAVARRSYISARFKRYREAPRGQRKSPLRLLPQARLVP